MRTPLYNYHLNQKSKMVNFHGWEMPLSYTGIIEEHVHTRKNAGIFDLCHMGMIKISGENSSKILQNLTTNNLKRLNPCDIQYSLILNENGGIKDDVLVYRMDDSYLLIVNAGNKDKIFSWLGKNESVDIEDFGEKYGMFALQGPSSLDIMKNFLPSAEKIKYYKFEKLKISAEVAESRHSGSGSVTKVCPVRGEVDAIISRTGYTGEDGFEILLEKCNINEIWEEFLKAGKDKIKPIGLGARDTLRLEAGLPLYGNELGEEINPLEAGLERFVKIEEKNFIGKDAILKAGVTRKLAGFELFENAIPRNGCKILKAKEEIGFVTSGTYSPTFGKSIGTGYVKIEECNAGNEIEIDIRNKPNRAKIIKMPFYRRTNQ